MNPKAEALKQRTFAFALSIIKFTRALRDSWEGRELSDQLFRWECQEFCVCGG